MKRQALLFTAPGAVEVIEEDLPGPQAGQVLVEAEVSAISAGTEMLVYRGQTPAGLAVDETLPALRGAFGYPMRYGYAAVGIVREAGPGAATGWIGRRVFAFHPHASHFWAEVGGLQPLPADLNPQAAPFLANMETAVTLLHDGRPLMGERVVVFGQGVVGLLTTSLLAHIPLAALITLDRYALRRERSLALGAHVSLDPMEADAGARLRQHLGAEAPREGADLIYELSGSPEALDRAVEAAGFNGRVIVGSWYSGQRANLDLGARFHRMRIQIVSSQVSTLDPALTGRWSKERRLRTAWDMLAGLDPARLITHRFPIEHAEEAYRLLDERPEEAVQVLLTYSDAGVEAAA